MYRSINELIINNSYLDYSGCILWTGTLTDQGYGKIGKLKCVKHLGATTAFKAHQLTYTLYHGPYDRSKMLCHTCHNRNCINVSHLYLGTAKDNCRDMWEAGRANYESRFGTKNSRKLTPEQVIEVRRLLKDTDMFLKDIGNLFGVTKHCIYRIKTGKTWGNVPESFEVGANFAQTESFTISTQVESVGAITK